MRPEVPYVLDQRGCHVWRRARNSRGYGVVWFEGKVHLAHRVSWKVAHGEWPDRAMVLDHICENKACVNVEHLRELTNSENIRRAYRHRQVDPAWVARRTRQRVNEARYRARRKAGN